jgi:hypothetical protein
MPLLRQATRSVLLTAAIIEAVLFGLYFATFPLIHTSGIGILGVILSVPQMPGLVVAGGVSRLLTRLLGSAPSYVGVPLFYAEVFLVQWLLIAALVAAWRVHTASGPWGSSS